MKNVRWISFLLAMLLCLCALPVHAETVEVFMEISAEDDMPATNDELFAMYAESQFYGGGIAMYARPARDDLTDLQKQIYDDWKPMIQQIAAGTRTSTACGLNSDSYAIPLTYTASSQNDAKAQLGEDVGKAYRALLADMPLELFWHGRSINYSMYVSYSGSTYTFTGITVNMTVADNYAGSGEYTVNTLPAKVTAAVNKAQEIVAANEGKSDLQKLTAYKEAICGLVDYNYDAAANLNASADSDPWQLIDVFDGDDSTKVVCEGYSKAFKYLCDLSTFDDVECYTVVGKMDNGEHMWNIVTLNGKNYLVDVTNSDAGSIGQNGGLFLAEAFQYGETGGYVVTAGGKDILYTYDYGEMIWGDDVTVLGPEDAYILDSNYQNTFYLDIDDALKAWDANEVLYVMADATVNGSVELASGDRELNLCGYTLTADSNQTKPMITISGGSLYIYDVYNSVVGGSDSVLTLGYKGGTLSFDPYLEPDNWKIVNSVAGATVGVGGMNISLPEGYAAHDDNGMKAETLESGKTYTIVKESSKISIARATITVNPETMAYTGQELKPAVTVEVNGTTLVDGTDYTLTYYDNVEEGEGCVEVKGIGNYHGMAYAYFDIVMSDFTITAPTAITGLTYTGEAQALVTAGSTNAGIMEYSLDGATWSTEIPTGTDAGDYSVFYRVTGDEVAWAPIDVTIEKATPTVTAPTANTGLTYTGEAQELVSAGSTDLGTLEYSTDNGATWITEIPTGTAAGNYTVSYRVVGDENINSVDKADVAAAIAMATPTVTPPTAITGLTYTGEPQELVTAGSTDLGTMEYSLDGTTWSTEIPTGTAAGDYTVSYRVTGDENINSVDRADVAASIAMAKPTVTAPTAITGLTYTGAPQELVSAGSTDLGTMEYSLDGTTWSTDVPTATDVGDYTVSYRVTGDSNIESVAAKTIDVSIAKMAPTLTAPTANTLTYTGEAQELVTAGSTTGGTLQYSLDGAAWSTDVPTGTAAGDYTVYYQVAEDDNFSGLAQQTLTVTIQPKAVTITGLTATDRAYNGEITVALTGGTVEGAVAGDEVAVDLNNATGTMTDANAGTDKAVTVAGVALSGKDAANYELTAQPADVTVTIDPAPLTLTAATIRDVLFTEEGNYTLEVTGATFEGAVSGESLTLGTDYTATAVMTGENKVDTTAAATVTVTLTNPNYTLAANTVASEVKLVTHSHEWAFTGSGDTITATCSGTIGTCPATDATATIQLVAPTDLTYDGTAKEATITQNPVDTFADLPAITYSGNATDVGTYTATLTYEGATATVDFTIGAADLSGATVTVEPASSTYDGTAKEPAVTVKMGETTLAAGTDYTVAYTDNTSAGTATVTVTGTGNYTGTASQTFTIEKAVLTAADFTFTAPADLVYDGNAKAATVTTDKTGVGQITISYAKSGAAADPVDVGSYTVSIDVTEGDNYQATAGLTSNDWAFAITAADTDVTAQADKAEYTYGETITVTASRAGKPATFALRTVPAADQMALFLDDTQVSDPVDAVNGTYTMTINTADKELAIGDNALTVKYVSNGNLSDAEATVAVKLVEKELTITEATATSRLYKSGDKDVTVTAVMLDGVLAADDVAVALTDVKGTLSSDQAGTYTSLTLPALSLTGADVGYYSLTVGDSTPTNVEIQKITLSSVTAPADATLPAYAETAELAAQQLPQTVEYSDGNGNTLTLDAVWTCDSYDATPGKTNTFTWTVDASGENNYAIDAGVATTGTITVTNADALAVTLTGTNATITFADQPYDVTSLFTVDANAGTAQYAITDGTGTGTLTGTLTGTQLAITKVGTFTITLTTEPQGAYAAGSAQAVLTVSKGIPDVTAPSGLTATYGQTLNDVTLPTATDGTWAWVEAGTTAVGDAGEQTHQAVYTPSDTDNWENVVADVVITVAKKGSAVTDMTPYLGTVETYEFTYGETITVKVEVEQTQTFALRLRAFTPPANDQMALFIGDRQISEPVYAENGVFTMTVDTTDKDLVPGDNTLIAKYVGNNNVAASQKTVVLTLEPKQLTVISIEAQDRAYQPQNQQVVITDAEMTGILGADDVTAAGAMATVSSANAADYSEATLPQNLTLSGDDAKYYVAVVNVSVPVPVTGSVTITQATPEPSPSNQGQPTVTPVTQPGKTLADVPLNLPTGSYNVSGTIQWIDDPTTPVERGKAYEWIFIPDDPNYAPVRSSTVIYPAGDAPVVTSPTEIQTQTVSENGGVTLTMNAKGATTYQWYVNRNDGNGYQLIEGATSASYFTGALKLADNGSTYYCKVSNQYGEAITPIYIVNVIEAVELPKTGDEAQLGLWYALMAISALALAAAFVARKRSKN